MKTYLEKNGRKVRQFKDGVMPGDDWVGSFLRRHQSLSIRIVENVKLLQSTQNKETSPRTLTTSQNYWIKFLQLKFTILMKLI